MPIIWFFNKPNTIGEKRAKKKNDKGAEWKIKIRKKKPPQICGKAN